MYVTNRFEIHEIEFSSNSLKKREGKRGKTQRQE